MSSERRTSAMSGYVNFPVGDPAWKSTNEGGMVVKLVVVDTDSAALEFSKCCGGYVCDMLSETFVDDDKAPYPQRSNDFDCDSDTLLIEMEAEDAAIRQWAQRHFPSLDNDDSESRYASRPYLAALVLGTTGWSGYSEAQGRTWGCTFEDLSADGKALYGHIQALYPHATLHLLTFLDT